MCQATAAAGGLGKNTEFSRQPDPARRQAVREKRFSLQRHVWQLLPTNYRLTACHSMAGKGAGGHQQAVEIRTRTREDGSISAHYGGVARCAAVWVCPVCAPAIAATRTAEITKAREAWEAQGGAVLLVTFTTRHNAGDDLAATVRGLRAAREDVRKHRRMRDYVDRIGLAGKIAALEVTHGRRHGWHPHLHELWFVDRHTDPVAVHKLAAGLWVDACERQGLRKPTKSVGFHVKALEPGQDGYIVQGADLAPTIGHELASSGTKKAAPGNRTLWQLLIDSAQGDRQAGELWRHAAHVLHGKASLFWSQGLKARFGINDKQDAEVCDERDKQGAVLMPVRSWHLVRLYGARAGLLAAAESGREAAESFIDALEVRNRAENHARLVRWGHLLRGPQDVDIPETPAETVARLCPGYHVPIEQALPC